MSLLFLKAFFALFGVIDPVGNTPIFLTLTDKLDETKRRELGRKGVLRAGVILCIFLVLGSAALQAFHVSFASFRIAGGLVLAWVGFQILFGIKIGSDGPPGDDDMSAVPIATPLLAGPGAIAAVIILAKEYGYAATLAGIAGNLILTWLLFRHSGLVLKVLGRRGAHIAAKFIGLVLIAMGVDFIRSVL